MKNTSNAAMHDSKKIEIDKEYEIQYWSNEFGISKEELIKAEQSGETSTAAVEKFVRKLVVVN